MRKKKNIEYAIYKGDKLITIGTAEECAKRLNISVDSVKWYSTKSALNRSKKSKGDRTIAVKIDMSEE